MGAFQKGFVVAAFLAVLTIIEYFFAVGLSNDHARFAGLAVAAIVKAWLIAQFFMHIGRVWREDGAH